MRDLLDVDDVQVARPWVWVLAFVGVVIGFGLLFPKQLAIVGVLLALPFIIFLHELAHFVTAKRSGMKVTEFFVGFGPRIWSTVRGETEYGLKLIPLGGYCRIIGMTNLEEVEPEDEPRAYRSKKFLPKVIVAGAGPAMHFFIALVLVFGLLAIFGDRRDAVPTLTLDLIVEDSPAAAAGLQSGDRVIAVDGEAVSVWDDVHAHIQTRDPGDDVAFLIERDDVEQTIVVVLEGVEDEQGIEQPRAGISPAAHIPNLSPLEALGRTPERTWGIATGSVGALGDMFSFSGIENYFGILSNDEEADENKRFLSPVGYARTGSQAVAEGWEETLILLILINVFIGMFNLLPLLPFDGGHIAIATYEKVASTIMRRPVQADAAKLLPLTGVVVAVLAFIFFSSLYLDIFKPSDNPF